MALKEIPKKYYYFALREDQKPTAQLVNIPILNAGADVSVPVPVPIQEMEPDKMQNLQASQMVQDLQAANVRMEEMGKEKADLEDQVEKLTAALKAAEEAAAGAGEALPQVQDLKDENARLQADMDSMREALAELEKKDKVSQETIAQRDKEIGILKDEVETLRKKAKKGK